MAKEKFCLRWNDFESNISCAFRELRDDKDFFDVTLACDDEQMQAHKVILSACSPFFHNILRRNPHQHPLLYLKGVKFTDLQSVLNFMYHGEVNVAQDELHSFLAVAEDLQVKGLTQNNQPGGSSSATLPNKVVQTPTGLITPAPAKDLQPPVKKHRRPDPPAFHENEDIHEVVQIKSEPLHQPSTVLSAHNQHPVALQEQVDDQGGDAYQVYDDYGQYQDDQQYADSATSLTGQGFKTNKEISSPDDFYLYCMKEPGQTKWKCTICGSGGFTNIARIHVRNHVESKHFPNTFQYQCPQCDKICNTKKALDIHKSERHRNT